MKTRRIALAVAAAGLALALGFFTRPAGQATASAPVVEPPVAATLNTAPPVTGQPRVVPRALPTVRRFDPPPIPPEDRGIAELVNAPDEPAAEVVTARWEDVDRRLEELFGDKVPAQKRAAIRGGLVSWIRDHGRTVRAYYRGNIDQAELTEHIHQNMLAYASTVEASLSRDQYRTFMDLEPGEDPFIVLVPPGVTVGDSLDKGKAASDSHADEHTREQDEQQVREPAEDYGDPEGKGGQP